MLMAELALFVVKVGRRVAEMTEGNMATRTESTGNNTALLSIVLVGLDTLDIAGKKIVTSPWIQRTTEG